MISNDLHKFRNTAPQLQLEIKLKRHEKQSLFCLSSTTTTCVSIVLLSKDETRWRCDGHFGFAVYGEAKSFVNPHR